jgi:hypothetical protein
VILIRGGLLRVDEIDDQVPLPPLTHEHILIPLGKYSVLSYNAMQAAIAINAVDSERQHQVSSKLTKLWYDSIIDLLT